MSDDGGWRPLQQPSRPKLTQRGNFVLTPFMRLARVHALSAAGDAMIAVALAGSLFFSIDPSAARWRVGLYLALTIAPFAVVAPLIGPAIDRARGGRRMMAIAINLGRTIVAFVMIANTDSLLLFPCAFAMLVLGKSFAVTKAALVPTTVKDEHELVDKNSRLALLSGLAGFTGAVPAVIAQAIGGPGWSVAVAMVAFGFATAASVRLPRTAVASAPEDAVEREELRSAGIVLAASAMGILRGIVGFMTFLIAFAFRGGTDDVDLSGTGTAMGAAVRNALGCSGCEVASDSGAPAWQLGIVVAFSIGGLLLGSLVAPRLRKSTPEENILLGTLALTLVVGVFGSFTGDLTAAAIVALTVGFSASAGKLAFDSIVQRDAPDANYGRTFARFETRFQLIWVLGALIPVVIKIPARLGFLVIAAAAGSAALSYFFGSRASQNPDAEPEPEPDPVLGEGELRPRYLEMSLRPESTPAAAPGAGPAVDTFVDPEAPPDPVPDRLELYDQGDDPDPAGLHDQGDDPRPVPPDPVPDRLELYDQGDDPDQPSLFDP